MKVNLEIYSSCIKYVDLDDCPLTPEVIFNIYDYCCLGT